MSDHDTHPLLALTTAPDESVARDIARRLLEARLVACVNILPAVRSMYWWQGKIEEGGESILLMKTTRAMWPALKARLPEWHPYEVPELVSFDVTDGLEPYLAWVVSEARGSVG